jgi:hypothetical protein
MKRLLYHVSDQKVDILDPRESPLGCICFSEGTFLGYLGQFLYIFDYETLNKEYGIELIPSGGLNVQMEIDRTQYFFRSQLLGKEYRCYLPIEVKKHALDVAENFNILKGEVYKRLNGELFNYAKVNFSAFQDW